MAENSDRSISELLARVYAELSAANSGKRAELLLSLLARLEDDADVATVYYEIEYGRFEYSQESFAQTEDEKRVDKLLRALNNVAMMHSRSFLTDEDLEFFAYRMLRVFRDPGIRAYLRYLGTVAQEANVNGHPYQAFERLGEWLERRSVAGGIHGAAGERRK